MKGQFKRLILILLTFMLLLSMASCRNVTSKLAWWERLDKIDEITLRTEAPTEPEETIPEPSESTPEGSTPEDNTPEGNNPSDGSSSTDQGQETPPPDESNTGDSQTTVPGAEESSTPDSEESSTPDETTSSTPEGTTPEGTTPEGTTPEETTTPEPEETTTPGGTTPEPKPEQESQKVATFTFGENGDATHSDGNTKEITEYTETDNDYSLTLSGLVKVYKSARDAQGNSCLKLGSSSTVGTFTFTVPEDVTKVVIYVAKYKDKMAKISINGGEAQVLTKNSDDGQYDAIEVDTSSTKLVKIETVSGGVRAMVNIIEFYAPVATCAHTNTTLANQKNASCTEAGYTGDKVCSACGETVEQGETIPAGHTYGTLISATNEIHTATELKAGVAAHYYCSACEKYFTEAKAETTLEALTGETPKHVFGDQWKTDGEKHWKECSCGLKKDEGSHSNGTATCQAKAICSACGKEYGELGNHSYDTEKWGYTGADGHAHKCTTPGCDEHDTVVPHTPDRDAATETEAKKCTVCGYVIQQQLDHVHTEGTDWEYDSTDHWHDCVGNDDEVYSKAAHEYDNACDIDCNVCGAERTIAHQYGELVLQKDATCSANGMKAHYQCSVCKKYFDASKVETTEEALNIAINANAHKFGAWTSNGNNTHTRTCQYNAEHKETDACSGGEATCQAKAICSTCNTAYGDFGKHALTAHTANAPSCEKEGNSAYWSCVCGKYFSDAEATTEIEENDWVIPSLGGHKDTDDDYKCNGCGKILPPEAGSPLTIEEAIALGNLFGDNNFTEGKYYVTGVIAEIKNTTYGNLYLKDENGNSIYVYGLYNADGSVLYENMETKPAVGDTITIYAIIGKYNNAPEIKDAWMTDHKPAVKPENPDNPDEPETDGTGITISFADKANRTEFDASKQIWAQNGITVTNNKASATTDVGDYAKPARFYKNSTVTISYPNMTKVVINCNSQSGNGYFAGWETVTNATVTQSGNIVTIVFNTAVNEFTATMSGAKCFVDSITVYTEAQQGGEDACEHNYQETSRTEATCTVAGSVVETCSKCGDIKTTPISALTHSYGNWEVTKEASCTVAGEKQQTCTRPDCNDVKTETIPAGHSYVDGVCTGCGASQAAQTQATIVFDADKANRTEFNKKSHQIWKQNGITVINNKGTYNNDLGDYANPIRFYAGTTVTIEFPGMTKIVIDCSGITAGNDQKYITNWESSEIEGIKDATIVVENRIVTITLPTPVDSITITMSAQSRANSITVYTEAQGGEEPECKHSNTIIQNKKDATCTEDGYTGDTYCPDCKTVVEKGEVIESSGHNYGEWIKEIPATCKAEGTLGHYTCSACGENFDTNKAKLNSLVIPKTENHTEKLVEGTPATCTQNGLTDGKVCSVCDKVLKEQEPILAGHTYSDLIEEQKEVHTSTELKASVAAHYYCSACQKYFTETKVETTLAALTGETPTHSFGDWINTDSEKHWKECSCGLKSEESAHAHTSEVTKDSTCTEEGIKTFTCTCGHTYTETIPVKAHTPGAAVEENRVEASCKAAGRYDSVVKCSKCQAEISRTNVTIPVKAHTGGTATCTEQATCSVCGEKYGNIGDHNYNEEEWGYTGADGHAHKCVLCDAHDTVVNHTPNVDAATEETAKFCTVCEYIIEQKLNHVHKEGTDWECNSTHHWHDCVANDNEVYSKAEHSYNNACDTDCNVCGYTRTITHSETKINKYDFTDKLYYLTLCSVCKHEEKKEEVVTNDPISVSNEADLHVVISAGYSVKIVEDIKLTQSIKVTDGKTLTIDLNGRTIRTNWVDEDGTVEVLRAIGEGTQVTIIDETGEGAMISGTGSMTNSVVSAVESAVIIIKNGYFYSESIGDVIFARSKAVVYIEGGKFEAHEAWSEDNKWYVLDIEESEDAENRGKIVVTGGTFANFDPANHSNDGTDYTNKVATGYHSLPDGEYYVVNKHNYTEKALVESNCTEKGTKAHFYCEDCGKYFVKEDETMVEVEANSLIIAINPDKHDFNHVDEVPATHSSTELAAGMQEHYVCNDCGKFFNAEQNLAKKDDLIIPAPTHSYDTLVNDDPDNHWNECECGAKENVTAHSYDTWVNTDETDHWKVCDCGATTEAEPHDFDNNCDTTCDTCGYTRATEHVYEKKERQAPTCSVEGMEAHFFCDVCDKYFIEEDETMVEVEKVDLMIAIDEDAHSFGDTWTSNGDGTHTRSCQYNEEHKENGNCAGGTAATCTQKSVCSTCNTAYGEFGAHALGEWTAEISATCEANGTKGHYHCSVCNKDFDADETTELTSLVIEATGHNFTDNECACGATLVTESKDIFANAGNLADDKSNIVWTNTNGTITFTNTKTKDSTAILTSDPDLFRVYKSSTVTISGNSITKIVITCTSNDYAKECANSFVNAGYTASASDKVVTITLTKPTDVITATAAAQWRLNKIEVTYVCTHTNTEEVEAQDPTCTEPGYSAGTRCQDCGKFLTEVEEVPATGHSYSNETHKCTVCSAEDPDHYFEMSISDALEQEDGKKVAVTGTVTNIKDTWNTQYNNMSVTITDDNGNQIYIYRLGTQVNLNDIITVSGTMATYNNDRQIEAGATATVIGKHTCSTFTEATCTAAAKCTVCGKENGEALGHTTENGVCGNCDQTIGGSDEPETTPVEKTYTFSKYTAGTQYAENEEHVLDENTTIYTTDCHFTTELRIYSSSTYNGFAIIQSTNPITQIGVNAGNKKDTLVIYGSNDNGTTWTEVATISVTSTSYNDYTAELGGGYKWLKLDVKDSNQVRLESITLTTVISDNQGGETSEPKCTTKCETCGKCTDADCSLCNEKCECSSQGGETSTEKTYSYTFESKQFTSNNSTKELNGVKWTLDGTGNGTPQNHDTTKGNQFGSKNNPYTTLTLTSDNFSNVSKIVINTSGASGIDATVTVTVGGVQIGKTEKLTNSVADYVFTSETPLDGEIVITYTISARAIYIKSITVEYAE